MILCSQKSLVFLLFISVMSVQSCYPPPLYNMFSRTANTVFKAVTEILLIVIHLPKNFYLLMTEETSIKFLL